MLSTVSCLQCKASKAGCDRLKPCCTLCLLRRRDCWYHTPETHPSDVNTPPQPNPGQETTQPMPVLRELCFVGQRFGALEIFLLKSYQLEYSAVMRSPVSFTLNAISHTPVRDGRSWAASITPVQAASHAAAWAAVCFGAVIQKHAGAEIFLGNAIQAARLCYDVPCHESLTALIAVSHAAHYIGKGDVVTLFAGYVGITREELQPDAVLEVKIQYLSGLMYLTSCGKQTIQVQTRIFPGAKTAAQDLSIAVFDSGLEAIKTILPQTPVVSNEQELLKLIAEQVHNVEQSLACAMQNRSQGDHSEIHIAITVLFFLYSKTGKISKLVPLAKQMIELYCNHPLMLHTPKWHKFAICFSRFLARCGEIDAASRAWSYLRIYRPLDAVQLGPLHSETEMGETASTVGVTREAVAEFYRILC